MVVSLINQGTASPPRHSATVIQGGDGEPITSTRRETLDAAHAPVRTLAEAIRKHVEELNPDSPLAASTIGHIWQRRDHDQLRGKDLLNDNRNALELQNDTANVNPERIIGNVVDLLNQLLRNRFQDGIISQYTKKEWLLMIFSLDNSPNPQRFGNLLREPKVFNWLYNFINKHAAQKSRAYEPASLTPESGDINPIFRTGGSLQKEFGSKISAAVAKLKDLTPSPELTQQIFRQIAEKISGRTNIEAASLKQCAAALSISFPNGLSTRHQPKLTEAQLQEVTEIKVAP